MRRFLALLAALACCGLPAGCKTPESSPLDLFRGGPGEFSVRIEGNRSYERRPLLREIEQNLREYVESGFRKYAVDDAAYSLTLFYQGEGFRSVQVDYEVLDGERERPEVVFRIEEGPRTELVRVEFDGNQELSSRELRELVSPESSGRFGRGRVWYARSRLDAARGRISSLYYERGYLEAEVSQPEVELSPDHTEANVRFVIREGPQYVLREVSLEGVPEEWQRHARRASEGAVGEPWFPRVGFEIESRVVDVAANRGHPAARAVSRLDVDHESGDVRVAITLDPGPKVLVGEIRVSGNERTSAGFVRSRLSLRPGDVFDRSRVRRSFRNLYETGLFDRVRIELEETDAEVRDLLVEVTEGSSLQVHVEPGYGSYERFRIGTGIVERNLFGTGRRLGAELTVAELAQRGTLRFTEPVLLGPDTDIDLEGFAGRRKEPSFRREDVGGALQVRTRWTRAIGTTVRYERVQSRATDIESEEPEAVLEQETVDLSLLSFTPSYDTRNAPFLPSSGTLGRFTVELSDPAIGSQLGYVRLLGTYARYFPIDDEMTFAFSLRSGVLLATDDTETFPIQVRFFSGGENTVRSFKESRLGPKDSQGEPLGGEAYSVLSMELRRALVSHLQGALFFDAGNVLAESSDYGSLSDLGLAIGVGLRWVLPIGPVRLDFGYNPDRDPGDETWVLHFSLGTAY